MKTRKSTRAPRKRIAKTETKFRFNQTANSVVAICQPIVATAAIQQLFN